MFSALQDGEIPVKCSEVPLLGKLSVTLIEVSDETSLRLNDSFQVSSQSCKTSNVVLTDKYLYRLLNMSSFARSHIKSQRY